MLEGAGVTDVVVVVDRGTGLMVHGFATVLTSGRDDIDVVCAAVVHHSFFRREVNQGAHIVAVIGECKRVELMVVGEVDDVGGDGDTGHGGFLSVVGGLA